MSTMMASGEREPESLDLFEFVDRHADDRPAGWLPSLGPVSDRLVSLIGSESRTEATLATNFWRAWLASESSERLLRRYGATPEDLGERWTVIVPRRKLNRFDLIVFDRGLAEDFGPTTILLDGEIDLSELQSAARLSAETNPMLHLAENASAAAKESANGGQQPFCVILTPAPRVERLYVPSTPVDIDDTGISQQSTAGIVVEDLTQPGRIGVTAALHGISGLSASVTVGGKSASVIRTHSITDSAFIEVADPSITPVTAKGVMSGIAPRGSQTANFVGSVSKSRSTTILAWDPQVPTPSAHRQACLYTGRDAQPGDSGCALVTDDDWIVGFAFERTLPGQNPVQCSWVWAESVLNGLQVKLI